MRKKATTKAAASRLVMDIGDALFRIIQRDPPPGFPTPSVVLLLMCGRHEEALDLLKTYEISRKAELENKKEEAI